MDGDNIVVIPETEKQHDDSEDKDKLPSMPETHENNDKPPSESRESSKISDLDNHSSEDISLKWDDSDDKLMPEGSNLIDIAAPSIIVEGVTSGSKTDETPNTHKENVAPDSVIFEKDDTKTFNTPNTNLDDVVPDLVEKDVTKNGDTSSSNVEDVATESTTVVEDVTKTEGITKTKNAASDSIMVVEDVTNGEGTPETNIEDVISDLSKVVEHMVKTDDISATNKEDIAIPSTSTNQPTEVLAKDINEVQTEETVSSAAQESLMEVPEMSDSLGLLTESAPRVVEEDEDQDEDEDGDDDEDMEDDKDNMEFDDESNLPTEEHSEDSNAPASDQEPSKIASAHEEGKGTDAEPAASGSETEIPVIEEFEVDETNIPSVDPPLEADILLADAKTLDETVTDEGSASNVTKSPNSMLKKMLLNEAKPLYTAPTTEEKTKNFRISPNKNIINMVELEGSSSEDDVLLVSKSDGADRQSTPKDAGIVKDSFANDIAADKTDAVSDAAISEELVNDTTVDTTKEVEDSGLAQTSTDENIDSDKKDNQIKDKDDSEVFNLDSDDEQEKTKTSWVRCANPECGLPCPPSRVDGRARRYYELSRRRAALCAACARAVEDRAEGLMRGVREMAPLLSLRMETRARDLVEISDSDSGSGDEAPAAAPLGAAAARLLEENLADMINAAWRDYRLEERVRAAKGELERRVAQLTDESNEIDELLNECQRATDSLREQLYLTFARPTRSLPPLEIYDTPMVKYSVIKMDDCEDQQQQQQEPEVRRSKRPRQNAGDERAAKRTAADIDADGVDDDTQEISVVALSREAPPATLPPAGELVLPALRPRTAVYAAAAAAGAWSRAAVVEVLQPANASCFTMCRVRFEHRTRNPVAQVSGRCLAAAEPANVRMPIGTRVIALFSDIADATKRRSYYSGVVAEMPNPVNSYRYLVFFDDGYAQYVSHADTRPVLECSKLVWEEVHAISREFVREYLTRYPERPMVRLRAGQTLKTEWNGKWWTTRVTQVDASLAQLHFEADNRTEWIYRGSSRLAPLFRELRAAERHRARTVPRPGSKPPEQHRNMPYVEYTRSDEVRQAEAREELRRQRAVAKKSTSTVAPAPQFRQSLDGVMSRVVYYTPKSVVKPLKMVAHVCSAKCQRSDALPLHELRTYNPLARPLLSGWERHIVRFKGRKEVMYRAPCGRRLRTMDELHTYLMMIHSEMSVDLFDMAPTTHCLAEFVLSRCIVSKKDLSHGKENVPVPCVNYYDTSLPEFCSYNTERTPTAGVPLNTDPEFLCGCDCTDDCRDKSACACWRLTLSGARTVGLDGDVGYRHRRLPDPVPSGIYECNARCKCKKTCLNRVAQNPLQLKLQVFKTQNRGWGIRALNDIPKGMFICVYAGNLLTDATANLDGLNEGDEYLAELDYIEVVEQMKEGYEEDVPEKDKLLDQEATSSGESAESAASDDGRVDDDDADGDFRPAYEPGGAPAHFKKSLRKRGKKKETEEEKPKEQSKREEDCITISDDEEVREPSRFAAAAGMGEDDFESKYRSVRSYFGKDEACYIMDAKVQGNIGRYLNHSCTPNVFVQNVFVDTHDPRFPWVAFFALAHVAAGAELTWNYNYDVGSVPGKTLYCYCGAPNCRGRLL